VRATIRELIDLSVWVVALWPVFTCEAADQSGVSPQAISLPSGPGSIEGLGEKFEPQLNSGTFSYTIPLKLPPVRGGAPSLALQYSSGNENGMLGLGWALRMPSIRRQTDKGLPQYLPTDLLYDENAQELVHLADGSYRQKIEGSFIRYQQGTNGGWTGSMPNGTLLTFGSSPQSRLDWTGHGTFCWMVDSSQDPNGNVVQFFYTQGGQQIYPSEIRYGLHATQPSSFFSVQFGYSTNRPDPFVDCRPRFASTNQLRLHAITVFYGARRIRQWQFGYDPNAWVSSLRSVTQFGDDRSLTNADAAANVDYLPPTQFAYTPLDLSTNAPVQTISFDPNEPAFAFANEGGGSENFAAFVDINHDGLPDILINSGDQWRSLINPGRFTNTWPLSQVITNPPHVPAGSLGLATTSLVDLNGDGKAKLMVAQDDTAAAFDYYDFLSPATLGPPQVYLTENGITLGQSEVQFVDLDDDKAMDVLRINGTGPYGFLDGLYTRNYLGSGHTNEYFYTPNTWGFDFTVGWQLADMNGDRLQDFVWVIDTDNTAVSLNLGRGSFAPPYNMTGGPSQAEIQAPGTSGPQLIDINQDGLADLVMVENEDVKIWLNQNGTNWAGPILIQGTPPFQQGQTAVRFADINGNGSVDIIWHQNQDARIQFLDLFPNGKANLLNHASTTLGRTLDLTYANSTDYLSQAAGTANQWTLVAPFSVPVMSQAVEGDGLGNFYTNQFSYRNDYYDPIEHQFRGFEQAAKVELGNDDQGAPTLETFFQFDVGLTNEAMKGKPLRVEADTASGGVFYRQTNSWTLRNLNLPDAPAESRTVFFAFQNNKLTEEVELGPETNAVMLEEAFDYDNYGNQVFYADYGRVENGNRAAWNDERLIFRQFSAEFPTGTNLWLLDRLVEQDTADINTNVFARQQVFYDDPTFAGDDPGVVTLGNPTLIRDWISISNNTFRPALRKEYDAYGNVTGTYDPLGLPGQPAAGHHRQIAFDPQIHTHPVTETIYTANPDAIAAGAPTPSLAMQASYDYGLGVMLSATDFNQNTTLFSFDTFGRISTITKPYDTTNLPSALFSYLLRGPAGTGQTINSIETDLRQVAGQNGTFSSRAFFDGLGRKMMTRAQSETNGVVVVNGATLFNQRRNAWRSFLPYFETGTLAFAPINQAGSYGETDYDALGRGTVKSQPPTPPETYRAFSLTTYGPLTRLVQDEEQTQTASPHYRAGTFYVEDGLRGKDGHGRLRQVQEIVHLSDTGQVTGNPNAWLTQYTYDPLDDFLGYTDSQGNQKFFQYDALRRKTFMNDPDRGIMQWTYDPASNVTNTSDAKGQQIVYTYDGANRLQTENYLDGNPFPPWRKTSPLPGGEGSGVRASVVYHYDLPLPNVDAGDTTTVTGQNTLGKLAWVEDLSGEEHTSYDARGRLAYTIKRLPDLQFLYATNAGLNQPLVSYMTAFAYDSLDRMTTLTYPDSDAISYTYNNRNLLQSILGGVNGLTRAGAVIENVAYQASAQLGSIQYGNGMLTQYGYDPRLRLASMTTAPKTNSSAPLIAFAYAFDDASNIKTIYDNRPTSVVAAGDPRRNTQLFQYDDLYRITYAGYAFGPPGDTTITGSLINYNYDRIGNMLSQTSTINDSDPLTGLPVANLGAMTSGGSSGTWSRVGRAATDPPGPHALSQISNSQSQIPSRNYAYDANGNMLNIDGLTNTWDFKDRLVAVRNSQMTARYLYDYTDRRVSKNVVYAPGSTNVNPLITTLYINKYFEVREYDQPTKYVWNGNTRVARVIGSLSNNERIQHLRLWPGWNLFSLAVEGAALPPLSELTAFLWNPLALNWSPVSSGQALPAGSVFWIEATTNTVLTAVGSYADPLVPAVTAGPNFLAVPGLEVLTLPAAPPPSLTTQWRYDARDQFQQVGLAWPLTNLNSLPPALGPGEVLFVRASSVTELGPTNKAPRICYYHQDHLGSSSVVADGAGQLVEGTAYYAFGKPRSDLCLREVRQRYKFSQKEADLESGSAYCEARYLALPLARFLSSDPAQLQGRRPGSPRRLNPYCYVHNNPLTFFDPSGQMDVASVVTTVGIDVLKSRVLISVVPWVAPVGEALDLLNTCAPIVVSAWAAYDDYRIAQSVKDPVQRGILMRDVAKQIVEVTAEALGKKAEQIVGEAAGKAMEGRVLPGLMGDFENKESAELVASHYGYMAEKAVGWLAEKGVTWAAKAVGDKVLEELNETGVTGAGEAPGTTGLGPAQSGSCVESEGKNVIFCNPWEGGSAAPDVVPPPQP